MDAQQFLAEFGHIANAPGGVARLRELVLSLAFKGELCPHSSEFSDALLKDIERQRLELNGETRKQRLTRQSAEAEIVVGPYAIPRHWRWTSLSTVGHTWGQKTPDDSFVYIDVSSIDNKAGVLSQSPEVLSASAAPSRARKIVKKGTLVYSTVRPYLLNIAIIDRDFKFEPIASTAFAIVHPWEGISTRYLYFYLRSPIFVRYVETVQIGMAYPAISDEKFYSGVVPLPPTEEQSRIVAKVDELMALCDKLEAQQQDRRKLQNALRLSTLQAVSAATSPFELQTTWARLADNFGRLFSVPEDVADIRQLAMDLAVRGLLTEQRDDEEPAFFLLDRIALEHKKMVLDGTVKRPKPLPEIYLSDTPFELPRGWAWARFPEIGLFGRGKSKHRPRNDPKLFSPGIYPLVQTGEVARANGVINEYHSKYSDIGLAQSKLWPKGTLCITIAANIADAALLGFDACFPDSVVGFIPATEIRSEVEYFLLFMKTARERLLAFAPSTAQKNINLEILQSVLIPVPPKSEIKRILSRIKEINALCDSLVNTHVQAQDIGKLFVNASIASITGITAEQEEEQPSPLTEMETIV